MVQKEKIIIRRTTLDEVLNQAKAKTEQAKEKRVNNKLKKLRGRMRAQDLQSGKAEKVTEEESRLSFEGLEGRNILTAQDLFLIYQSEFKKVFHKAPLAWGGKEFALAKKMISEIGSETIVSGVKFVFSNWEEYLNRGAYGVPTIGFIWGIRQILVQSLDEKKVLFGKERKPVDSSRNKKHVGEFGAKKQEGLPEIGWGDFWK
jgi:hypothetical protein